MKDLYNCCQNVDAKSIALYSGIKIVGASVSEPHTSESNWDFSYNIYYIFSGVCRSVYSQSCNLTR